ncbi:MAG: hypothetical protein UR68_C0001G0053 [Candidatus Roizmanbacteria bacterium GW2011_GWA2_35_19]|uniref:HD domain-containing protein n=1 Tax=Candidatus Roizmanbacteria bacterium GW2011_GWA2_35_19 TaxID=1618478 RepID=A0A0G0BZ04_9BACT|nr:MAG: hypothetical protein UR68_C0001G0053 [Candidatus Roizmanbacteria bacterium GW2011_GWA2_35_19]
MAREFATPLLLKGRKNYDLPHTKNVDYFASRIASQDKLDELVLRTAAWLHDTGYADLKRLEPDNHNKEAHAQYSVLRAREFFNIPGISQYYEINQIRKILRIIEIHDSTYLINEEDERAFLEADVLGAISTDTEKFKTFQEAAGYSAFTLLKEIEKFRPNGEGSKILKKLLPGFLKDLKSLPLAPKDQMHPL